MPLHAPELPKKNGKAGSGRVSEKSSQDRDSHSTGPATSVWLPSGLPRIS
jgi:hypothetical protein